MFIVCACYIDVSSFIAFANQINLSTFQKYLFETCCNSFWATKIWRMPSQISRSLQSVCGRDTPPMVPHDCGLSFLSVSPFIHSFFSFLFIVLSFLLTFVFACLLTFCFSVFLSLACFLASSLPPSVLRRVWVWVALTSSPRRATADLIKVNCSQGSQLSLYSQCHVFLCTYTHTPGFPLGFSLDCFLFRGLF